MMGTTHQQVGVAAAVALCAATSMPLSGAVVVCAAAARWSSTPDRMEKRFRAEHRTWTHWLGVCVATAVLPVAVVVLVLALAGGIADHGWRVTSFPAYVAHLPAVMDKVSAATAHGHGWRGSPGEFLAGAALIAGALVVVGRLCGMVMHTFADACTPHGSPLWGPLDRTAGGEVRCRHLLPRWLRVKTDSVDDTSVGVWALGLTILIVYVQARGFVLPSAPHQFGVTP